MHLFVVVDFVERWLRHIFFVFGVMFVFVTSLFVTLREQMKKRKHIVKNNNNLP